MTIRPYKVGNMRVESNAQKRGTVIDTLFKKREKRFHGIPFTAKMQRARRFLNFSLRPSRLRG